MGMKAYPSYKDSGAPWIGDIPTHWTARKIKTLFRIKKEIAGKEGYNVLSITQQGIKIKDVESNEGQIAQSYTNYQLLNVGEFAMNHMDLLTGWVDISPFNGVTSPDYRVFIRSEENASSKYLLYTLQTCYSRKLFYGLAQGVSSIGRCRLQATKFKNFVFPLPPTLEEQNAIVAYLDKKCAEIDELVTRRQAIIERLKELKQSIIADAVTKGLNPDVPIKDSGIAWLGDVPKHWKILRLKNVASVITDTLSEKTNPDFEFDYVDISSVTQEQGIIKTERFKFSNAPSRARRKVQAGDIIISTVRTYLRAIAVISKENENIIASTGFAVVRSKQFSYVAYVMSSHNFVSMVSTLSTGVSYPAITSNKLLRIHITFPPEEEQQVIVAYLDKKCAEIDELISRHERTIEKLKELKTSTIAHVVTGKVDVRDAI